MKVLITGADGFVGRNLVAHLNEMPDIEVVKFGRGDDVSSLHTQLPQLDFIFTWRVSIALCAKVTSPQGMSI